MRRTGALAAAFAFAALAGAAVRASEPAPSAEARPAQAAVDAAVARGVAWLRAQQERGGAFGAQPGETALALLALRHSGVDAADPDCRRAAAELVRELPDGTSYGASLGIVALLAQDDSAARQRAETLLRDLVAAQCDNGQWSYSARRSSRARSGDNSNTQLAMFALAAAESRGLPVPGEAFERCAAHFRATQNDDGGWGYAKAQRADSYASMTCGAVMSLAICARRRGPSGIPPGEVAEVRAGLAWLAERFDAASNSGAAEAFGSRKGRRSDDFWRHYWLWSLERAAAAVGAERLGEHDWYGAGARFLLSRQRRDGSWVGPERSVLATSFALLFLARGSERVITPRAPAAGPVTPR